MQIKNIDLLCSHLFLPLTEFLCERATWLVCIFLSLYLSWSSCLRTALRTAFEASDFKGVKRDVQHSGATVSVLGYVLQKDCMQPTLAVLWHLITG